MSGVRTGTRLERLLVLRRQVKHQLAIALRDGAPTGELTRLVVLEDRIDAEIEVLGGPAATPAPAPAPETGTPGSRQQKAARRTAKRMEQLGVTQRQVKEWAVEHGLLDQVRRGKVRDEIVQAYAAAHQPTSTNHQ